MLKTVFFRMLVNTFFICIQIFIIILASINYINVDSLEIWAKFILIPCIPCFIISFIIYFIISKLNEPNIKKFFILMLINIYIAIILLVHSISYVDNLIKLPIKLDYTNNQIIDLNTNKKLKPILKSADYSSSKGLDEVKNNYSRKIIQNYKLLIDNDKNYYIFETDNFKKEFNLKSVYFNKKTYSLKYTYSNKENKELYEIKENISAGGFYKEYEKYAPKFKKIKINEDEELFSNN